MKALIIAALLFTGCAARIGVPAPECPPADCPPVVSSAPRVHTVYAPPAVPYRYDSLVRRYDSIRVVADTVAARLLHARLVISNVRYYLNITIRNPSQDKFLKGWIRRALE